MLVLNLVQKAQTFYIEEVFKDCLGIAVLLQPFDFLPLITGNLAFRTFFGSFSKSHKLWGNYHVTLKT